MSILNTSLEAVRKVCSPEKAWELSRTITILRRWENKVNFLLRCWESHEIHIGESIILWNDEQWVSIWNNKFVALQKSIMWTTSHNISEILNSLWKNITGINHLWICYHVPDNELDSEITSLVESTRLWSGNIFRDPAWEKESMEWIFLKDPDIHTPMFEFVLPKDVKKQDEPPHFQIDLDTDLSQVELVKKVEAQYWRWFFNWSLDIPEAWWVVLNMGTLDDTEWFHLRLGLGTNIRNRRAHRDSMERLS